MTFYAYTLCVLDITLFFGSWDDYEVFSVFREEDRADQVTAVALRASEEERHSRYLYECSIGHLCHRLDVMGFTLDEARRQMDMLREKSLREIKMMPRRLSESMEQKAARDARIQLITTSTFEEWRDAFVRLTNEMYETQCAFTSGKHGPLDQHLYTFSSEEPDAPIQGIYDPFSDPRFRMRAMFSAFRPEELVRLDFTPMVDYGEDPALKLTQIAIEKLLAPARATEPIVVLTEGRTDTRILSASLEKLYPHLHSFYAFLDHERFAPLGGTGGISNLIKGLAGCGISNRVVALFDNDAAGMEAAQAAEERGFPNNFRMLRLPFLERARSYPTLGPTGPANIDINGSACGIELYLGTAALTGEDGTLMPVQWTGYLKKVKRYQGELLEKEKVQERYLNRLKVLPVPAKDDPEFNDMRGVLQAVFNAFAT